MSSLSAYPCPILHQVLPGPGLKVTCPHFLSSPRHCWFSLIHGLSLGARLVGQKLFRVTMAKGLGLKIALPRSQPVGEEPEAKSGQAWDRAPWASDSARYRLGSGSTHPLG